MDDARILLGVVGRPHGVRGLVRLHSYTGDPRALAAYGPLTDEAGRVWTVVWRQEGVAELRDGEGRAVADRDAAARLTNTRLFIERGRLPAAGEEEYYLGDLVGLAAVSGEGGALGAVTVVHDYGAGVSLELSSGVIVPFTRACVPEVDLAGRRVVVVRPVEVIGEDESSGRSTLTPALSQGERELRS